MYLHFLIQGCVKFRFHYAVFMIKTSQPDVSVIQFASSKINKQELIRCSSLQQKCATCVVYAS